MQKNSHNSQKRLNTFKNIYKISLFLFVFKSLCTSYPKNLDSSLKFPGSWRGLPLAQEELTYMQMKQRNPAAWDPERKEEDQDYTHVHWALEKTPSTPAMLKLHN